MIEVASQYPDVEGSSSYFTLFIKVASKVMALLRFWAQGGLALRCDVLEQETMVNLYLRLSRSVGQSSDLGGENSAFTFTNSSNTCCAKTRTSAGVTLSM